MMSQLILPEKYKAVAEAKPSEFAQAMVPNLIAAKIGLKQFRQIGRKGNLAVFLSQIRLPDANSDEPSMVLANVNNPRSQHVHIPLSQLWMMIEPRALTKVVPELATQLFGFVTKDDCFRVLDAIYDFAEDLQKAPPPNDMTPAQWAKAINADGWSLRRDGREIG